MIRRLVVCCLVVLGFQLALAGFILLSHAWWLDAMGRWLVVDDQLVASRAIVAVSGQNNRRRYAIKLYRQGYAECLIFNVSDTTYYFGEAIDPVESILADAAAYGLSPASILINRDVTSTWQDAHATLNTLRRHDFDSVIVVSSPLHMRRVKMTYDRVLDDAGIRISYCSIPLEEDKVDLNRWWTREREFIKVYNEYLKIGFYCFKYFR
ncbi:MAG: YdcF family protein [Candidatus Glassbacteria bacterium]|nr:YdcF family protein [Candidatus Glassbacteria bacterium]